MTERYLLLHMPFICIPQPFHQPGFMYQKCLQSLGGSQLGTQNYQIVYQLRDDLEIYSSTSKETLHICRHLTFLTPIFFRVPHYSSNQERTHQRFSWQRAMNVESRHERMIQYIRRGKNCTRSIFSNQKVQRFEPFGIYWWLNKA